MTTRIDDKWIPTQDFRRHFRPISDYTKVGVNDFDDDPAPEFAVWEITELVTDISDANSMRYVLTRPTDDSLANALVAFSPSGAIPHEGIFPINVVTQPMLAHYDSADGTPAVGDEVGTKKDSFFLSAKSDGFVVVGVDDEEELVYVRPFKARSALVGWGANEYGQCGVNGIGADTYLDIDRPRKIKYYYGGASEPLLKIPVAWQQIECGDYVTFAIDSSGSLWRWGYDGGAAGDLPYIVDAEKIYASISSTSIARTMAITTDGKLWLIGTGQVGSATDWDSVACGYYHAAAITAGGTLWTWGTNTYGNLGQGDTSNRASPTQVGSGTDWAAVAVGEWFTLARKTDGTLWFAGRSNSGQGGQGDTAQQNSFVQIGSAENWTEIAAGTETTYAVNADGEAWSCGKNNVGQSGVGDTTEYHVLTQIGTDEGWSKISAKTNFALGLKTDWTLYSWGYGARGQLGLGVFCDALYKTSPQQIGTKKYTLFSAGGAHCNALVKTAPATPTRYCLWLRVVSFSPCIYDGDYRGTKWSDDSGFGTATVHIADQQARNLRIGDGTTQAFKRTALDFDSEISETYPEIAAICPDSETHNWSYDSAALYATGVSDTRFFCTKRGDCLYAVDAISVGNGWYCLGCRNDVTGDTAIYFARVYKQLWTETDEEDSPLFEDAEGCANCAGIAPPEWDNDWPYGMTGETPNDPPTSLYQLWLVETWTATYSAMGDCAGNWSGGWSVEPECSVQYVIGMYTSATAGEWEETDCYYEDYCPSFDICTGAAQLVRVTAVDPDTCLPARECGAEPDAPTFVPSCCGGA